MDHIFRIAFCMLSISYLQGKPTPSTNIPTFDFDTAVIKDILGVTKKLLKTDMTCVSYYRIIIGEIDGMLDLGSYLNLSSNAGQEFNLLHSRFYKGMTYLILLNHGV